MDNWIYKLYQDSPNFLDRKLEDIYIPATHDSCMGGHYNILYSTNYIVNFLLNTIFRTFVYKFITTQYYSVREQLFYGVRAFDIRCYYDKNKGWLAKHDIVVTNIHIKTIMTDVNEFLLSHPYEFVILDMSHITCTNRKQLQKLSGIIRNTLKDKLYISKDGSYPNQEIVRNIMGKVIVIWDNDYYMKDFVSSNIDTWRYDNKLADTNYKLQEYVEYWKSKDVSQGQVMFIQLFLQQTMRIIFYKSILSWNENVFNENKHIIHTLQPRKRIIELNGWKKEYLIYFISLNKNGYR